MRCDYLPNACGIGEISILCYWSMQTYLDVRGQATISTTAKIRTKLADKGATDHLGEAVCSQVLVQVVASSHPQSDPAICTTYLATKGGKYPTRDLLSSIPICIVDQKSSIPLETND